MMDRTCPGTVEPILEILDGKWTPYFYSNYLTEPGVSGNYAGGCPISPKTLTDRLRLLEEKES